MNDKQMTSSTSISRKALKPGSRNHRTRKTLQVGSLLALMLLLLSGQVRVDFTAGRLSLFSQQIGFNEHGILALVAVFALQLAAAVAVIYGRFFCGYVCPQMTLSEAANALERRVGKLAANLLLVVASIALALVATAFFVPLTQVAASGLVVLLVLGAVFVVNLLFVRQKFCTSLCPYGALQRRLADQHTLQVIFTDDKGECISCDSCLRACPVGIDIRRGASQPGCSACGECLGACQHASQTHGGTPAIHYAWGQSPVGNRQDGFLARLGLRDAKRLLLLLLLAAIAIALSLALHLR